MKRILTAADITAVAPGGRLELAPGAILTPAARDAIGARGITVAWCTPPDGSAPEAAVSPLPSAPATPAVCISPEDVGEITRLVRQRLGEHASAEAIEQGVVEVLRSLPGGSARSSVHGAPTAAPGDDSARQHLVITVIGRNRPGIVAGIAGILAESACDILDMSQTLLGRYFSMIMLVDFGRSPIEVRQLQERLEHWGTELGVKVIAIHETVFLAMQRI